MKTEIKSLPTSIQEIYQSFLLKTKLELKPIPAEKRMNIAEIKNLYWWQINSAYRDEYGKSFDIYAFSCSFTENSPSKYSNTPWIHEYLGNLRRIIANKPDIPPTFFQVHLDTLLTTYTSVYVFPESEHELIVVMCLL